MKWPLPFVAVLVALTVLPLGAPATAGAAPPNPPQNLEIGSLPGYCSGPSPPSVCADGVIYYLDQARAAMGLGPYALPANFLSLSAAQQMFILSDLDRVAYGLPPVEGLNSGLDGAATAGAKADEDPMPTEADLGRPFYGWTSNWAGAFGSTTAAYFMWMYDDGYGGGNLDCQSPTSSGCWGHRQNILWAGAETGVDPNAYVYSMGAAETLDAAGGDSYALTILASKASAPPSYYYTWAQAVAEGAGTNEYRASLPVAEKVRLSVALHGQGRVSGLSFRCRRSCSRQVEKYEPLTLHALPAPGYRLGGWRGCDSHRRSSCVVRPADPQAVRVTFIRRGS